MAKKIPDSPSRSAYLNIVIAWDHFHGDFGKLFRESGLTPTVFNAMRILVQGPKEGMRIGEVGDGLIQRVPDITRLLDRMERDGYVTRLRNTDDRRAVTVQLTRAGKQKCESMYVAVAKMHATQFQHMTDSELRILAKLLEKAVQG
ncbi:MAG: MarR family transcriptional regulator [Planctomycetota bacterium]|nr:MarR family transcriptional regulator [Planctomycetota bacterium]MDA1113390.1 MarR family transcriptional regulator [Planctomycetota bacterium]